MSLQAPINEPRELPSIRPPVSSHGSVPELNAKQYRPMVQVRWDGQIILEDGRRLDPNERVQAGLLHEALQKIAGRMQRKSYSTPSGKVLLPADNLLIRADRRAPFRSIQILMRHCASPEIKIWRIQLAVILPQPQEREGMTPQLAPEGRIDLFMQGNRPETDILFCPLTIDLRLKAAGTKRLPGTTTPLPDHLRIPYEYASDRVLSYCVGPRKMDQTTNLVAVLTRLQASGPKWPAYLAVEEGVTCGEAQVLIDACMTAGFKTFRIQGGDKY